MENLYERLKSENNAFTHAGRFHADDVFSFALIRIINPKINVVRGNEVPENFNGIVFDIGYGEFDHHQQDSRIRENGVPYAAFGLLWEQLGEYLLGSEEAKKFDEKFVQPLDENDNTGCKNVIANLIGDFNPCWDGKEDNDEEFFQAVEFATHILENRFNIIKSRQRAAEIVNRELENNADKDILILKSALPWRKYVIPTDIKYVIHPSNRGGFCAIAVPKEEGSQELKVPFIREWRGKEKEEIRRLSGISTLTFCHKSGFMISADTLEGAVAACRASLDNPEVLPKIFVNCSQDSYKDWEKSKISAAKSYGDIADIRMPVPDINDSFSEIGDMSGKINDEIIRLHPSAVYLKGDDMLMYEITKRLLKEHITVVAEVTDKNGKFISFREYL